jgi:hypothetical protein
MKAAEKTLQQILHSADQYVIPVFQRYYVWKEVDWERLWSDLEELCRPENLSQRHFLGSVVCVPELHQPGTVPGFQVIDGQQRLMTLSLLLCGMRAVAVERGWQELGQEIHENYLIHRFKKERERYKIFPRMRDRGSFLGLIDSQEVDRGSQIYKAYNYHLKRLDAGGYMAQVETLRRLFEVVTTRLDVVAITLTGENPFQIFKSLNSTGVDLEEGDLIRNHLFMGVSLAEQDAFDDKEWTPLEAYFEEKGKLDSKQLTGFLRDVLMMQGEYVGKNETFRTFERRNPLSSLKAREVVRDLIKKAKLYDIVRGVRPHADKGVEAALVLIRELGITSAYPAVLVLLDLHASKNLNAEDLAGALRAISGFVVRRIFCRLSSRTYGQWFCTVCKHLTQGDAASRLAAFLSSKGWPSDREFVEQFPHFKLYDSNSERVVLTRIERSIQNPSEPVGLDECWIEHVMPQTIAEDAEGKPWVDALGPAWQELHQQWLHTPGNLTLVGSEYNIKMQNQSFAKKRPVLAGSKVYMNKHFATVDSWCVEGIVARGRMLGELAAKIWVGPPVGKGIASDDEDAPDESPDAEDVVPLVLARLGGVKEEISCKGYKYQRLNDGHVVHVKYSRRHTSSPFWYGVKPGFLAEVDTCGCEDLVLVFADEGFARFPLHFLKKVMTNANKTENPDGTVEKYHLSVSEAPEYEMFTSASSPRVSLREYFRPLGTS